jgi:hypothetical protein
MSDHIGETNAVICPHCGLPADRKQNGIQGYRCGSSYEPTFKPQWARSMTCLEMDIRHLNEDIGNMNMHLVEQENRINRMEAAGNELRDLCVSRWMGDVLDQAELVCATDNWNKATAKEAKP